MTTEQRRLAAIVSADVAGYSRLLSTNRTTALAAGSTPTPSAAQGVRAIAASDDGGGRPSIAASLLDEDFTMRASFQPFTLASRGRRTHGDGLQISRPIICG